MTDLTAAVERVMRLAPVIPVLVIEDIEHALPIAEALVAGGLPALEVTLRTECAIEAIKVMKQGRRRDRGRRHRAVGG